jgi:hypothetical protein
MIHAHPYKWLLVAGFLAVPFLVLTVRNDFQSSGRTIVRVLAAVIAGWAWLLASTLLVTEIDMWLATSPEEMERIMSGDGAKFVAVLFLGWVPTLLLVVCYWIAVGVVLVLRGRRVRLR